MTAARWINHLSAHRAWIKPQITKDHWPLNSPNITPSPADNSPIIGAPMHWKWHCKTITSPSLHQGLNIGKIWNTACYWIKEDVTKFFLQKKTQSRHAQKASSGCFRQLKITANMWQIVHRVSQTNIVENVIKARVITHHAKLSVKLSSLKTVKQSLIYNM